VPGLFRVGIIGAGRIAATFDVPAGPEIRTHMKAILSEPRLLITHIGDKDRQKASEAAKLFGVKAEIAEPDAVAVADVDALCIASPDGTHLAYAQRAADGPARVVLVEKPIEGSSEERHKLATRLSARGATLVLHHQRRWIPGLADWVGQARSGAFGAPLSATVHYTRGFRHNGVHALDLVAAFFGTDVGTVAEIADGIADFSKEDLTRSLLVTMHSGTRRVPLTMFGVDGRVQTAFSVTLTFERAKVAVFDEGSIRTELHRPTEHEIAGFAPELRTTVRFADDPPRLLATVWRNVADHLESGAPIACAGRDALAAYDLADAVLARCAA
jgi:predicted dehydrogenase